MSQVSAFPGPAHSPYAEDWLNELYNLLFCDRPQDMAARNGAPAQDWQTALCSEQPDLQAAAQIAADRGTASRLRLLACHVLRAHCMQVPGRELLGVVVEVPLQGGLDTLAAYADGTVRYINHSGRVEMIEAPELTLSIVQRLFQASATVVSRIGAWDQPRLPAPQQGHIRLNFLVSDGLYFGQGDMSIMQRDGMAGPVIQSATELMQTVIGLSLKRAA